MSELEERFRRAFCDDDSDEVARLLTAYPELRARIDEPIGPFASPVVTRTKSLAMLDVILSAGADIDAKSEWWAGGFGILHIAERPIADAAIERGATVDVHAAARLGMADRLQELLDGDPGLVGAPGGDGQTPLHFASTVAVAELLLARSADIDAVDVDHESTPAQYMTKDRLDVAGYLVARGCKTDLLLAAALGDQALAGSLLDRDPDSIRIRVSDEWFPMIGGETGGTIYQWNLGWHVSPHQVARSRGYEALFDFLWQRSPPDEQLLNACWTGDGQTVDVLLSESPDLANDLTPPARRSLAHAARNGDLAAVRLMLLAGFPVDGRSQHGATALHWAAWHGDVAMTQALLARAPDLDDQANDYGSTAVSWAAYASENGWNPGQGDHAGVVTALLEAGARPPDQASGSPAVRNAFARFGIR